MNNDKVNLKYRFEKATIVTPPLSNAIERFGRLACHIVQYSPSVVPNLSFGRAEKIADGFLDPGLLAPQPKFNLKSTVRLRCIEDQKGPLVEYHYDKAGRICEVVLLGSLREKYSWSDDGKLISVAGRDSQLTRFAYHKEGMPASISYSDGSVFKYAFDHTKRLSVITYPDGKTLNFARDASGRILQVQSRDGVFEYAWNDDGTLNEVTFRCDFGTWGYKCGEVGKKLKIRLFANRSGSSCSIASALGMWRYDSTMALREMFFSPGERLVWQRWGDDSEIVLWSSQGQTTYRFDKKDVLMSILNANGTQTLFKRFTENRVVIMVSATGIAVLKYDEAGNLKSDRSHNGDGTAYDYTSQGKLKSIFSKGQSASFAWNGSLIEKIVCGNDFTASVTIKSGCPNRVDLKNRAMTNANAVNAFVGLLWNWQAMKPMRRLNDAIIIGGHNGSNT